jgi:DNA-binding CsgD family transcriptional regulator
MVRKGDQEERLSDLIGQVYDASLDPTLWGQVASSIAQTFNSTSTALLVQDLQVRSQWLSRTANLADDLVKQYDAYYHKFDEWALRGARKGISQIFIGRELISDAEFSRTEYYNDWCRKTDSFHLVGSVFSVANRTVAILGVHRPERGSAYTPADKVLTGRLICHLRRALQLRQRLSHAGIERQAALDALERTGVSTLVVGRNGHVIYANRESERLLREGDVLRVIAGKLVARLPRDATRLAQLIQAAVDIAATGGGDAGEALKLERAERLPLTVLVAPFRLARDGFGAELPAAMVFIRDPERLSATGVVLQSLFGLTVMEACIAAALCQGKSLEDIIREHGISINTAKTHLKGILLKTNTRRQAELVALLLRSVAVLGGAAEA